MVVTLDPKIEESLEALGAVDEEAKQTLVREMIREAIDERAEDEAWVKLADDELRLGEDRAWDLDSLLRGDDLAG